MTEMNSEQPENQVATPEDSPAAIAADKSLTLAAKKLAGSSFCLNCGTPLKGPFCHYCGQPDRNFMRFFPVLLRDLMEDLLDLDSRFMRTIKPLLFKPGRLTRDYMEGRRFRYAPPMRLYIFSSILFFLLAALLSSDSISVSSSGKDDSIIHLIADSEEEEQAVQEAINQLPEPIRKQIKVEKAPAENELADNESSGFEPDDIQFNDEPWDRETNPVDIRWLPDWLNDRINEEIENSPKKAEQINENPNLLIDKVFDILPAAMFILLPVVALILKFWYLFAKRFYIEHLIFSLHNHAFIFVSLTLILLANLAGSLLGSHGYSGAASAMEWLVALISIWIPIYLFISLRVVYQQGWLMTQGKFLAIGMSYMTLLIIVSTVVSISSFVLL